MAGSKIVYEFEWDQRKATSNRQKHGVPFELHVYPYGRHGLGLAPEDPHIATWTALCCEWLRVQGW